MTSLYPLFLSWAFYRLSGNCKILLVPQHAGRICSWGKPGLGHDLKHRCTQAKDSKVCVAVGHDEFGDEGITICVYHLFLTKESDGNVSSYI